MGLRSRPESLLVAALLAATGGFLDAHTYLARGGVLAAAQTGNVVLLAVAAGGGDVARALSHVPSLLAFLAGVLLTEVLGGPRWRRLLRRPVRLRRSRTTRTTTRRRSRRTTRRTRRRRRSRSRACVCVGAERADDSDAAATTASRLGAQSARTSGPCPSWRASSSTASASRPEHARAGSCAPTRGDRSG